MEIREFPQIIPDEKFTGWFKHWQKIKEYMAWKQCGRCMNCACMCGKRLHVHHIIPLIDHTKNRYRLSYEENLVGLCPECHRAVYSKEFKKKTRERIKIFWDKINSTEGWFYQNVRSKKQYYLNTTDKDISEKKLILMYYQQRGKLLDGLKFIFLR